MNAELKRLPARFYRTDAGREPVRDWLKRLSPEDRKVIGEDIKDVEFSWPIGMPLVRPLGRELWEVRSSLSGGRIARVLFCVEQEHMVLLHGFIKKSQKILILLKNSGSPFDWAQGERGGIDNVKNIPFMLSPSKHS